MSIRTLSSAAEDIAAAALDPLQQKKYAVVDHAEEYEAQMNGRHGQQLELAKIYGHGLDEPAWDPFADMEQRVAKAKEAQEMMEDGLEEAEILGEEEEEDEEDEEDDELEEKEDEEFYDDAYDEQGRYVYDGPSHDRRNHPMYPYTNSGRVRYKRSQLKAFEAGLPAGGTYAIMAFSGRQYKFTTDDVLVVDKQKPAQKWAVGTVHTITDILLVGTTHKTLVGMPFVTGAEVDVMVEEQTKDKKVIVFKKKAKKNWQRKNGHRRDVTMLRILDIRMPEAEQDHNYVPRVEAEE